LVKTLAKLRKNERRTKQTRLFFLPSASNFALQAQSYEKTREEQNKLVCFFFRDEVTSPHSGKVTKKRGKNKTNVFVFSSEPSKFVTQWQI